MNKAARKILKAVAKRGELPLDKVLKLNQSHKPSHTDQYPLALLLEEEYLGVTFTYTPPLGTEKMREFTRAVELHMFTLPKNDKGEVHYMNVVSRGAMKPSEERVFIKAKGTLYLENEKGKGWSRLFAFLGWLLKKPMNIST